MTTTCTGNICQPLFERMERDPAEAVAYLQDQGFHAHASSHYELGLNAIVHVLILFTALTFLFMFLVSKTETRALQGEFDNALTTNLRKALESANTASNGDLRKVMVPMVTPLEVLQKTVDEPDGETEVYNRALYIYAFLIIGILGACLVTMLLVMSLGAGVPVAKMFFFVLVGNLVLFALVGGTEYVFFQKVATKYIPVKPSLITQQILTDIKTQF